MLSYALIVVIAILCVAVTAMDGVIGGKNARIRVLVEEKVIATWRVEELKDAVSAQLSVIRKVLGTEDTMVKIGRFTCTAYEKGPRSCGKYADGYTATLIPVGLGIAAADTRVLPYGTILYVEELGEYFIVMDRGGKIKGRRLDLYTNSVGEALELGRFRSNVYIVGRS